MRAIGLSFFNMLKMIRQDRMLLAAGMAPFLAVIAIRYAVPLAEGRLVRLTGAEAVIPYFVPTPFCFGCLPFGWEKQ